MSVAIFKLHSIPGFFRRGDKAGAQQQHSTPPCAMVLRFPLGVARVIYTFFFLWHIAGIYMRGLLFTSSSGDADRDRGWGRFLVGLGRAIFGGGGGFSSKALVLGG